MNLVWFFALARHATFPSSNIVISSCTYRSCCVFSPYRLTLHTFYLELVKFCRAIILHMLFQLKCMFVKSSQIWFIQQRDNNSQHLLIITRN